MLEKLIWISAFMLVGALHPGATVGVVEKDFRFEVRLVSFNVAIFLSSDAMILISYNMFIINLLSCLGPRAHILQL